MQNKAHIIARLKEDILSLQGYKPASTEANADFGLGRIRSCFPQATFPFSALHEFSCEGREEVSAAGAFVTGLLSSLFAKGGMALWVSAQRFVFPPALTGFGINPYQLLFVEIKKPKDIMWVIEEALKCKALTAVIAEVGDLDFTQSRRLQLAIEQTGVGCFLIRHNPRRFTTASTSRWAIKPLPSEPEDSLPGIGCPRWQVSLLKVRNGKPGSWVVEWAAGRFRHPSRLAALPVGRERKTG